MKMLKKMYYWFMLMLCFVGAVSGFNEALRFYNFVISQPINLFPAIFYGFMLILGIAGAALFSYICIEALKELYRGCPA